MLLVATASGSTLKLDLSDAADLRHWLEVSSRPNFIRAVSLLSVTGARADLPLPRRFQDVRYEAELLHDGDGKPIAERASVICDGAVCIVTMSLNGDAGRVRVDVDKRGVRRFRPS